MTEKIGPVVSVIMPAYNAQQSIAQSIESVIAQTYENWELIVVDDCSKDNTSEIVRRYADADRRVHLYPNQTNLGAAGSRNEAFRHCSGEYIAFLDSDDLWMPEKLEKQVALALSSQPDIIYTSYEIMDDAGKTAYSDFIVPTHTDFDATLKFSPIGCSTAFISRKMMEKWLFPTDIYQEDYAYWLLLLKNGATAAGIQDVLVRYRYARGTRSSNKIKNAYRRWQTYRDYLGLPFFRSVYLSAYYGLKGIQKYRPVRKA